MAAAVPNRAALLHAVMEAMTEINRVAATLDPRPVGVYDEDTREPLWGTARRVCVVQHSGGSDSGEGLEFEPAPRRYDADPLDEITGTHKAPAGSW